MPSQNFEFLPIFEIEWYFQFFFIYKNGETSDESIFSRVWEFVDFFRFPKNNFLSLLPSFRLKTNQLIKKFSLSDFKYHRKKHNL